jgi:hypothetical protein
MTAIDDKEISVHNSAPIELYEFVGSYKNYYFTSTYDSFFFKDHSYIPVPGMIRSSIKAGSNADDNATAKITLPVENDLIADYGFQVTPPKLQLNIYRIYRDLTPYNSNFRLYWTGPVTNISIKGTIATLDVPSILSNNLGSHCPSVFFQTPCNNVLFDELCGVSRDANLVNTTITSLDITKRIFQLASLGAFTATDFIGGEIYITAQNERRMIVAADVGTGNITVNYPFGRGNIGDGVQITRGCDHAWKGDCKNRYNNTSRFGGHPLIPALNLFESGF